LALLATSPHRPMPSFMRKNDPLHLVSLGANRTSTNQTLQASVLTMATTWSAQVQPIPDEPAGVVGEHQGAGIGAFGHNDGRPRAAGRISICALGQQK
jgi:hypothetical protein